MRLWLQQRNYQFTIGKCRSTASWQQISYIEQAGAAPSLYTTECQASTGSFYTTSTVKLPPGCEPTSTTV